MTLINKAISYATLWHAGQTRKYYGEPYMVHPTAVALTVAKRGYSDEVIAAALCHDVLEDTAATTADMTEVLGERVTQLVLEVTDVAKPEDGNRAKRKEMNRAHLAKASQFGKVIKLADLIDNTQDIVVNDPNFAVIYMSEKKLLLPFLEDAHDPVLLLKANTLVNDYYAGKKI
jgi:(p)ppGpp synthase/HD superfamily hydrolase